MKGFTENLTYDGSAAVKARLEFRQIAEPYKLIFAKIINIYKRNLLKIISEMKRFTENLTYYGSAAVKARMEFRQIAEPYKLNFKIQMFYSIWKKATITRYLKYPLLEEI